MQTLKLIVREVRQESPLIRSFRLAREDAGPLPAFGPGAHLKVTVPGLRDPRCYSLVQLAPQAGQFAQPVEYRLGVRLEESSQGGSRHMHGLAEGDVLTVEGPKNDFPLHESPAGDEPVVLIAGGIGITPVASMAAALKAAGRDFHLHYCGRSKDQLAFLPELAALAGDALTVHADDDPSCRFDLQALLAAASPKQHLYVCGPKGLIDAVIHEARARHWPDAHIHFELFVTAAPQAGDQPFEVELRQSGRTLTIPADKTIVDVMEEEGCDPMFDCKRGECGVCQATVLEGEPDHRDYYLSDTEKASGKIIQICISRAKSARLVLDL
ncbi:oxidoreductase [Achromobacter marplatensis]|uniref:Vanillate O-demethylase ferredoxin subunit n=1 Tax=Achromobacter marplatensis TaxID=470868 RepID=A0ABX9GDL1_9BURK|nr:PDR/VanB family oxidoreductase [Achromobacter marplatensis]EJO29374.1 oxidoreductase FAD-binding domain-containing protein 1 [Achromobacter marplatensis]OWT70838.1 oxidoreductase [Achromobacter marplatensis]RBP22445.1 vanillate O-demethylase ferredoxin subunit [Achromobacter marplatensis]CAB3659508.1 Phthalate dioxygenase reductase [Achromobacter marplatensis]